MAGPANVHEQPPRISVQEMRRKLQAGDPALLVCIYDHAGWSEYPLEGSISLDEFEKREPKLKKDHEIAFY